MAAAAAMREGTELRTVDVVDLLDTRKTFAYVKYKMQVRVPKSSPLYRQRASETLATAASKRQHKREKYFMTSISYGGNASAAAAAAAQQAATNEIAPKDALTAQIQPVQLDKPATPAPPFSEIASLIASSFGPTNTEDEEAAALDGGDDDDAGQDPLLVAQSELAQSEPSVKIESSQLIDCFIVDTLRRAAQRKAIVDEYAHTVKPRRVHWRNMLATIKACRNLTWRIANETARAPAAAGFAAAAAAEQPLAAQASERQADAVTQAPVHDFFTALFGAMLGSQPPATTTPTPGDKDLLFVEGAEQQAARVLAEQQNATIANMGSMMISAIVPNTLWCGLGDRATSYAELGVEWLVDSCCRAHDHCPVRIKPLASDYGLVNWSVTTRSHCDCDLDFNDCLVRVNSTLARVIRTIYFRVIAIQCIDVEGNRRATSAIQATPP